MRLGVLVVVSILEASEGLSSILFIEPSPSQIERPPFFTVTILSATMFSQVIEIELPVQLLQLAIEVIIEDKFQFSDRRVCVIYEYGIDVEALEIVGCRRGGMNGADQEYDCGKFGSIHFELYVF